jgi:hypothetical protein
LRLIFCGFPSCGFSDSFNDVDGIFLSVKILTKLGSDYWKLSKMKSFAQLKFNLFRVLDVRQGKNQKKEIGVKRTHVSNSMKSKIKSRVGESKNEWKRLKSFRQNSVNKKLFSSQNLNLKCRWVPRKRISYFNLIIRKGLERGFSDFRRIKLIFPIKSFLIEFSDFHK